MLSGLSEDRLTTCHPDLVRVIHLASSRSSFQVLCGHRNEADQERAFAAGRSKEHWPHSRHNSIPSEAADLAPIPLDWSDTESFRKLIYIVRAAALELGVELGPVIKWDLGHFELARKT